MGKGLEKNGFGRLVVFAVVALLCVCMWGCSDDVDFAWDSKRSGAVIVGFVNDSLVMVEDYRCWHEYTEHWNGGYSEDGACEHARLCLYNYRVQEKGPRWCDSLVGPYSYGIRGGQLSDSTIWGGFDVNSITLWKIGEQPHKITMKEKYEGCTKVFKGAFVKEWLDGTFIGRGDKSLKADGDNCQYAILDTNARTITYKRLDKELAWIKKCDDVRTWGDDVYCIILDDEGEKSLILKNKNDTIPAPQKFAIGGFWGGMIKMNGNICLFENDNISCSDVTWRGNELKFYRNGEVVVEY